MRCRAVARVNSKFASHPCLCTYMLPYKPKEALEMQVLGYEGLLGAIVVAAVGVPLNMLLPASSPGTPGTTLCSQANARMQTCLAPPSSAHLFNCRHASKCMV